ncbi:hypothetical protein, partial [Klebsiella pneumoniae]|uniref:hypothetical protein n=1 Tax=Klebsiella pneumoniae TaxID=573 RepID=UPI00215D7949
RIPVWQILILTSLQHPILIRFCSFPGQGKFGLVSLSATCFWVLSSVLCISSPLLQNVVQ